MQHHNVDIYGALSLVGSVGSIGQVLTSQGVGASPVWGTLLNRLYAFSDKPNQAVVGIQDLTWNAPGAGASSGVTYSAPGVYTLPANRTFLLLAYLYTSVNAGTYGVKWVNSSNVAVGVMNVTATGVAANQYTIAIALFKTVINTDVKLRSQNAANETFTVECSLSIQAVD